MTFTRIRFGRLAIPALCVANSGNRRVSVISNWKPFKGLSSSTSSSNINVNAQSLRCGELMQPHDFSPGWSSVMTHHLVVSIKVQCTECMIEGKALDSSGFG